MNAKPAHASYHLESQVDLRIAGDSTKGVNVEAARLMSVLGQLLTSRRTLDLVCFVPCVDGSLLARVFWNDARLVGAAMCPAC